MKLKELREKQQKLVADARAKIEEITADTSESRAKEIETEYDAMMREYDALEQRAERLESIEARERALEEAINAPDPRRPNGENRTGDDPRNTPPAGDREARERQAFRSFLQGGVDNVSPELRQYLRRHTDPNEQRALSGVNATTGGYLVPQAFVSELFVTMRAYGPMLDPGITRRLETAQGNAIGFPTMDDSSNEGQLIAENTQVQLNEVTFGLRTLGAFKYTTGMVLVPSELMADSALNVEQTLRDAMGERIGRIGNRHLTVGDGASKPVGIVTAAAAGATAAAAAAISLDDFIELQHSVDPAYRSDPSCRWMMHDSTLRLVRRLKDLEGNYIWQPANAQTGAPATIFEFPYSINQAMETVATGRRSLLFGAMRYYIARVVSQVSIRRLTERYADFDQIGFIGFARLDGNLMDAGAVRHLVHP